MVFLINVVIIFIVMGILQYCNRFLKSYIHKKIFFGIMFVLGIILEVVCKQGYIDSIGRGAYLISLWILVVEYQKNKHG